MYWLTFLLWQEHTLDVFAQLVTGQYSLVKNRLFKTAPDINEPPFQFIHTMDLSVVRHEAA